MRFPHFVLAMIAAITTAVNAEDRDLPPDSAYVVVEDGHLSVDGQRQRFWAVIGKPYITPKIGASDSPQVRAEKVAAARRDTDALLDRFEALGFNSVRLWDGFAWDADYTAGDGSRADSVDYFLYAASQRGFRVWTAGLNQIGGASPEDVDIVDDPATADAWKAAVAELPQKEQRRGPAQKAAGLRNNMARIWDPRLEVIAIRDMVAIATHRNQHSGLRWCDDPVFAVWELSNEEWWLRRMVGGSWQKLPAFFRQSLVAKWNDFLVAKYADDAALTAAWGDLLPGETLTKGTVVFAPMAGKTKASVGANDANTYAQEALVALDQEYSRDDFSPQRASDVLEFLVGMQVAHKQREAAAIKALGKSTRMSPMIYDTGIGYEIQSQYLHQHADAVAHDAYSNGYGPAYEDVIGKAADAPTEQQRVRMTLDAERVSANDGDWVNWLRKPPGMHQGVPWLEHNKIEGKPYLCYETQIQQPAKYRADYPLRLAALASIQDWDWICWHYFASGDDVADAETPFAKPLDVTTGGHPQGYHFTYDEVQSATMRAAAEIFLHGALKPASKPTTFIWGRKSLYNPASMDYAGSYGMSGLDMNQTVYQYGVRIAIDPTREDDEVIGPVVSVADRSRHNPYTPTDEIRFDWKAGNLRFDAPNAVAFTGFMASVGESVTFRNGLTLGDVEVHVPDGMPYGVGLAENKYIGFCLTGDLRRRATIALVSSSFNTDYKLTKVEGYSARGSRGELPVLVARVSGTITSPALTGMTYTFRDWHMNEIGTGTIADGTLRIPADLPIFITELSR